MRRKSLRLLALLAGLIVLAAIVVTVLLAAPFLSRMRAELVERMLSDQLQHELRVHGDVRIALAPVSRLHVSEVEIPSEIIEGSTLAELTQLELDVNLMQLINGRVDLNNILVRGLQVNLLTQEDGTRNWYQTEGLDQEEDEAGARPGPDNGILAFLSTREAHFENIGLSVINEPTGFNFDFVLEALDLTQLQDGQVVSLDSNGTVNGQPFDIEGTYPRGAAFTTRAAFGNMVITFDGAPVPDRAEEWQGRFALDSGQFSDLLEILGLDPVLDGSGTIAADLGWGTGQVAMNAFLTDITFSEGQNLRIEATAEDLRTGRALDIRIDGRFHPEGAEPPKARKLKELKLTGIDAHVTGDQGRMTFETLFLRTNAFGRDINRVGPISLGRIHRTDEGLLAFDNLHVQAGPEEAPFIVANGSLGDVLQLRKIDLSGTLSAPANVVLGSLGPAVANQYGRAVADFALNDDPGHLTLSEFTARTEGSELWVLDMEAAMKDVTGLGGFTMAVDLDIPDTARFFRPMGIEIADSSEFELTFGAEGSGERIDTRYGLRSGRTRIDAELDADISLGVPVVRGRLHSELIDMNDLRRGVRNLDRFARALSEEGPEVQPLVLDEEAETGAGTDATAEDRPDVQPLVLEQAERGETADAQSPTETARDDGPDVQPLVLEQADRNPIDLLDPETLLRETDLEIVIDLEKIVGQDGVSRLSSSLTAKNGKADLGPVEVTYGEGFFSIHAGSDLVADPRRVTIRGNTSGWRLKTLLELAGVSLDARGKVRGQFNVTGNLTSLRNYVNSMAGSVTVSMGQGAIATSLLELAGLGVFPWLFSKELQQGYTEIVCVVAPIRINGGKVSSDAVVVETKSVQLVAAGGIDWKRDTIALRAEPRRVGQPLARSAWPFQVTGRLSSPDFKLLVGGSRPAPRDGEMPANRQPCQPDLRQLQ